MIFLKDVNTVNTLFQKREPLVAKIQQETRDIFNSTINLILLDDYRTMNINEKLKLFEYIKENKTVTIDAEYLKNPNLSVDHLLSIHKNEISWNIIKEIAKKDEISKNMIEYIKRLTYKMTQLFPFDDELLQFLSCLSPKSFNCTNWKLLANTCRYTNIISADDFKFFYKQLEKFEIDLSINKEIFCNLNVSNNLMKFYNHKDIKQKYCMMSKLASSLLCLPFSNSEIERMFSQFKLTKTQLRISLNDDTIEGLMLLKMNSDLLDIKDKKILQKICERYVKLFEKRI